MYTCFLRLEHRLGQSFVQYISRTYHRSGTLWEGLFRTCLTQEEDYLLGCYRHIEVKPVRTNMVEDPAEYFWSSYRANAQGVPSILLTHQPLYTALGNDGETRQATYRALFRYQLDPGIVDEIRSATNGNYALGSSQFQAQVSATPRRRVPTGKSGRPRKRKLLESQDLFGDE